MKSIEVIERLESALEILPKDILALQIAQRYRDASAIPSSWTAILECRKELEKLRAELKGE